MIKELEETDQKSKKTIMLENDQFTTKKLD
jgi:hypothetical protein